MKTMFVVTGQFLLFFVVDAVGSLFYHPFHLLTALSGSPLEPRTYLWDGVVLMLSAYLLVLLIAALRKRVDRTVVGSTVALLLAGFAGYLMRFGFITQNW